MPNNLDTHLLQDGVACIYTLCLQNLDEVQNVINIIKESQFGQQITFLKPKTVGSVIHLGIYDYAEITDEEKVQRFVNCLCGRGFKDIEFVGELHELPETPFVTTIEAEVDAANVGVSAKSPIEVNRHSSTSRAANGRNRYRPQGAKPLGDNDWVDNTNNLTLGRCDD